MRIIVQKPSGSGRNPKVLADVKLVFDDPGHPLEGLELLGISIWHTERGVGVTLPSRKTGSREYELLRAAAGDTNAVPRLRQRVLDAFNEAIKAWQHSSHAAA